MANTLYIRKKPDWINILRDVKEFDIFMDSMTSDKPIVIGDIALFNAPMRNRLLKVIEEYHHISMYSSIDIDDPILLSRVFNIIKEPVTVIRNGIETELYNDSPRDFQSVAFNLSSLSETLKLRATKLSPRIVNLIIAQNK